MLCDLKAEVEWILSVCLCSEKLARGSSHRSHVDPAALCLRILCHLVPAGRPEEGSPDREEMFQDIPCAVGPAGY